MTKPPTLNDGVPPLTSEQHARLVEWLQDANKRSGVPHQPHDLAWTVRDETRPDRGYDLTAVAICSDYVHTLMMDPYGNGSACWGAVIWVHSSAEDECSCEPCVAEIAGSPTTGD